MLARTDIDISDKEYYKIRKYKNLNLKIKKKKCCTSKLLSCQYP